MGSTNDLERVEVVADDILNILPEYVFELGGWCVTPACWLIIPYHEQRPIVITQPQIIHIDEMQWKSGKYDQVTAGLKIKV